MDDRCGIRPDEALALLQQVYWDINALQHPAYVDGEPLELVGGGYARHLEGAMADVSDAMEALRIHLGIADDTT